MNIFDWKYSYWQKSLFTEEKKKYFSDNGFVYDYFGNRDDTFYFFDDNEKLSFISVQAYPFISETAVHKHLDIKYLVSIVLNGNRVVLPGSDNFEVETVASFSSFKDMVKYIEPFFEIRQPNHETLVDQSGLAYNAVTHKYSTYRIFVTYGICYGNRCFNAKILW